MEPHETAARMSIVYRYRADHRVSAWKFARLRARELAVSAGDLAVEPVDSALGGFLFIVGCGHSGTTLLNARLGNHRDIHAIPEETQCFLPVNSLRRARHLLSAWATDARLAGKSFVAEKTPKHVHCTGRIWRLVPEARVVVMVRNPLDNCASLVERFGDLELAVSRWILDNQAAAALRGRRNVHFVRYEDFVQHTEAEARRLLAFLGAAWDDSVVHGGSAVYEQVDFGARNMARRQSQVRQEISPRVDTWRGRLTGEQARLVVSRTASLARSFDYEVEP